MQETTSAAEALQETFQNSLTDGLWNGFMMILPYIIGAVVLVIIFDIIKVILKKKKK